MPKVKQSKGSRPSRRSSDAKIMKLTIPKFDHFARGLGLRLVGVYRGGPEMPSTHMGKGRAQKKRSRSRALQIRFHHEWQGLTFFISLLKLRPETQKP